MVLVDLTAPDLSGRNDTPRLESGVTEVTAPDAPCRERPSVLAPGQQTRWSSPRTPTASSPAWPVTTWRPRGGPGWSPTTTADLIGWLSPDGSLLLVERNDDGASELSLHDAATGAHLRDLALPAAGCVTDIRLA